ncbi:MAG: peptidylprolyl isomerase [Microbacteriaceae bacterium]|nr:peptidylprolyl isomerase [Microbacteriaceae bacterium]
MRKFSVLAVAAAALVALTACSPAGSDDAQSENCAAAPVGGHASSIISAPGSVGSAPKVSFPTPLITTTLERTALTDGLGSPVQTGQPVILEATVLNGTDGSELQKTGYTKNGGSLFTVGDKTLPALSRGLACALVGSRVAIVASAKDNATAGQTPGRDSIVYVVDILRAFKSRADGADQAPVAGLPTVVIAPDGTPGVTIPHSAAPGKFVSSVLKLGEGKKLQANDIVVAKVTSINWSTRAVVDSTWKTSGSTIYDLGASSVTEGVKRALVGHEIGSQILAIVPPALAVADGAAPADATLIYVIDILGTVK